MKNKFFYAIYIWIAVMGWCGEFVSVGQIDGRWYLIAPDGTPFISQGVNHINKKGGNDRINGVDYYNKHIKEKYPDYASWGKATEQRLMDLGFNTAGAWSNVEYLPDLYCIKILYPGKNDWDTGEIDDYFSDEFHSSAGKVIEQEIVGKNWASNPRLIGYCIGNELRWGIDWRSNRSVVLEYLTLSDNAAGKRAVVQSLAEYYKNDIRKFRREWLVPVYSWDELLHYRKFRTVPPGARNAEKFLLYTIARQYYQITSSVIRKYDPNHLILGSRFIGAVTPKEVVVAAGEYCDVISVNYYHFVLGLENAIPEALGYTSPDHSLKEFYELGGRPILVTEFGFRGITEHNRSAKPFIYPRYHSQKNRGKAVYDEIEAFSKTSYIVGYHLFQWMDQPPHGRDQPDGEDNNWGIVDLKDNPHEEFTACLKKANRLFQK